MTTPKKSSTKSAAKTASQSKGGAKTQAAKAKAGKKATPSAPDAMSKDVVEFITAIDDYKRKNQRPFPNWSEVLEIVKALGYARD